MLNQITARMLGIFSFKAQYRVKYYQKRLKNQKFLASYDEMLLTSQIGVSLYLPLHVLCIQNECVPFLYEKAETCAGNHNFSHNIWHFSFSTERMRNVLHMQLNYTLFCFIWNGTIRFYEKFSMSSSILFTASHTNTT